MNVEPYSALVRSLFGNPVHAGTVESGRKAEIGDQGVQVELSAEIKSGTLRKLRFRAWGCPHLIAAAEWLCAEYEGRPIADLDLLQATEVMQSLSVPVEKTGRILVLEDAARSLGKMCRDAS